MNGLWQDVGVNGITDFEGKSEESTLFVSVHEVW
jgi:hypothetical protein